MATGLGGLQDKVFAQVLGESVGSVEEAVIADRVVGETSLNRVAERLADLLNATSGDVLQILGVSRSKLSRNPVMDVEILDRAGSTLKLYARVAAMVGSQAAAGWLGKPNRHLGGRRPIDLMGTRLGEERLEDLVTVLEDGVYL